MSWFYVHYLEWVLGDHMRQLEWVDHIRLQCDQYDFEINVSPMNISRLQSVTQTITSSDSSLNTSHVTVGCIIHYY